LSPYFSLSHTWLTGLEFCIPPEEKVLSKLDYTPQLRGKAKKKGWLSLGAKKNEIELKVASIEDGTLCKHLFWEEYDQLVLVLLCTVVNFMFAEFWSCFTTEKNSIMTAVLVFTCGFCLKTMLSVIVKLGLQSYELRLTIFVGIISFLFSFAFLELPENIMDYSIDLRKGFDDLLNNINQLLRQNDYHVILEVSLTTFKILLAMIASCMSSIIFFPGFRLARSHHEMMRYTPRPYHPAISNISFLLPAFVVLLWLKPITRDMFVSIPSKQNPIVLSHGLFEVIRFYLMVLIAILRLYLLRPYMQSFLATAVGWAELLLSDTQSKERGRNIKYKILGIYSYLCVAAVQILAPSLLLLSLAFILKSRGMSEISLFPYCNQLTSHLFNSSQFSHVSTITLFSDRFYKGIFSFLSWWFLLSWFLISCFALLYERNQSIFAKKEI